MKGGGSDREKGRRLMALWKRQKREEEEAIEREAYEYLYGKGSYDR